MAVSKVPQTAKKQIDTMLHVFGGADGGVSFARFKFGYEQIEKQALAGDNAAAQIMAEVQKTINLLQLFGNFDNDGI